MSKKPRVKKNNPVKRKNIFARTKLSGFGVAAVNDNKFQMFSISKMMPILNVKQNIFDISRYAKIKWNIFMVVSCTESNGKTKLISDQILIGDECFIDGINHFLDNEYLGLIDRCEEVMTVNYAGWMATHHGKFEPSDIQIEQLMNQLLEVE